MNEIVRKVVPLSSLPEDLRQGFAPDLPVEIVGHPADQAPSKSLTEIVEGLRQYRRPSSDALERVEAAREEWAARDAFHDHIRAIS